MATAIRVAWDTMLPNPRKVMFLLVTCPEAPMGE